MKHWSEVALKLSSTDIKLIHYINKYAKKENGKVTIDIDEFLYLYNLKVKHSYHLAKRSLIKNQIIWTEEKVKRTNTYYYDDKIC